MKTISTFAIQSEQTSLSKIVSYLMVLYAFSLPLSTTVTIYLFYGIVLLWLVEKNFSTRLRFYFSYPLTFPLLAYIGVTFIGITYSAGSLKSSIHDANEVLRLGIIPMLAYYLQDERQNPNKKYILYAFVGALIFTVIAAFLKVYADVPIGHRTTGNDVFKNHIIVSYFMAMALFFLSIWLIEYKKHKLLLIALISLVLYFLIFINTGRVGYIFLYVCFAVYACHRFGIKGVTIALLVISSLLVLAYQFSDAFQYRINNFYDEIQLYLQGNSNTGVGHRLQFIVNSIDMFLKRPFFGFGTGSFKEIYQTFYNTGQNKLTNNPHNQYLFVAAELGIVGLMAFCWLLYRHWKLTLELKGTTQILAQALFLSFMIGCIFNSWVKNITECQFYCLMTAYFLPISIKTKNT